MGGSSSKSEDVENVETIETIPAEEKIEEEIEEIEEVMEEKEIQAEMPKPMFNVIDSSLVCEVGYKLDHEGKCRKIIF
ncbi:unnamed protein product [Diamesa serratosioi]